MSDIIKHKRSSIYNKVPSPDALMHGEVAINYSSGSEKLFIKNTANSVVAFSPGVSEERVYEIVNNAITGEVEVGGVTLYNTDYTQANFGTITLTENVEKLPIY